MNKLYIFIFLCLFGQLVNIKKLQAQAPEVLWAQKSTGITGGGTHEEGGAVANDAEGNSYIVGYFENTLKIGDIILTSSNGQKTVFVAKYNAAGVVQWAQKIGAYKASDGWVVFGLDVVANEAGDVYVTGNFDGTVNFGVTTLSNEKGRSMFLVKYNAAGEVQWAKQTKAKVEDVTVFQSGRGLAIGKAGDLFVTGVHNSAATLDGILLPSSGNYDIFIVKFNASGDLQWVRQAGGTEADDVESIALDENDNIYITGSFAGEAAFGTNSLTSANSRDVFIAQYNAAGEAQWVRQRNGGLGNAIAVDKAGNAFVTGSKFLASYDATGALRWEHSINNTNANWLGRGSIGITLEGSDNVYITGGFKGTITFGSTTLQGSGNYMYIAKYDAKGNVKWAMKGGSGVNDTPNDISTDKEGNIQVVGTFLTKADFGSVSINSSGGQDAFLLKLDPAGKALWAQNPQGFNPNTLGLSSVVDVYGNVYVTGTLNSTTASFGNTTLPNKGGSDIFLAKYSAAGSLLWAQHAGGGGFDRASSIALDKEGNVYLTGKFTGVATIGNTTFTAISNKYYYDYGDAFIAKFNPHGKLQWLNHEGGLDSDVEGIALTIDANNNIYVAGNFLGTVAFGNTTLTSGGRWDFYVAKYDATGKVQWAKKGVSESEVRGHSIAVDKSGNVYASGVFGKVATFDDKTLTASGDKYHTFLAKYDATGAIQWIEKGVVNQSHEKNSIVLDGSGNVYMAGYFSGTETLGDLTITSNGGEDVYLIKYTTSGEIEWVKNNGGTLHDRGLGIVMGVNDRLYMTGYFKGKSQFGETTLTSKGFQDVFVAQYDNSGNVLWAKSAGGIGDDQGASIASDAIGNIYITGHSRGDVTFDNTTFSSFGREMFLVKIGEAVDASNAPTAITLNGSSIDENNEEGVIIGTFHSADPANSMSFTYTFVAGEGDTDNAAFMIEGNELKAKQVFDYETKNSFSVRVQVINIWGLTYETAKTITINDIEETVTGIADENNELLKVYPNPTSCYLAVNFEEVIDYITMVNVQGGIALNKKIGAKQARLDLNQLTPGIYNAMIYSRGKIYAKRIIVVR